MSQIRSKDTKPEIIIRKMLYADGVRYRLHYKIYGNPDIAVVSKRVAIFIDGCFWHKCPKCFRPPKTRKSYWEPKIQRNLKRDRVVNKTLKSMGWKVIRLWEHEIKETLDKTVRHVLRALRS